MIFASDGTVDGTTGAFDDPHQFAGPAIPSKNNTRAQSRAIDEFGRIQPTRKELIDARGRNGVYHFHAVHSWGVAKSGKIKHVYA